jgi:glucans biosynthesis protein
LYGLSARGLAINTALDGGEEFPFFKEFWIIKPRPKDRQIRVDALLDSPSVAGAYEFIIHPGKETAMEVNSSLFIRKKIEKLGIAPMTSMFFYGSNAKADGHEDYRPQVHDSDGLSILTRWKEWIWRPLVNPKQLLVNSFEVATPLGFGLFQRDQDFDHYQDLEAHYELRPSLWVIPKKDWGKGHVELVQIPSGDEKNDNINVFWVPQKSPEPGEELNFSYTLQWCSAKDRLPPLGFVTDTFVVRQSDKKTAKFVIDFQGLKLLPGKIPTADISVTNGYKILRQQVIRNTVTGGWRLVFQIQNQGTINEMILDKGPAVDLRAFLKNGPDVLTETWDYAFMP